MTPAQRSAITSALGTLPEESVHAIRDARGHAFQRLEFLGDAVLELVVRFHAVVADGGCAGCGGDADSLMTDAALGKAAEVARLGDWLEWEPSHERLADLVEACSGAIWLARGWADLAVFVDRVVHPLAPLAPDAVATGWTGPPPATRQRTREVLGASVLEVAAAHAAFVASDADEGLLTTERNRLYATHRVVEHALDAGWIDGTVVGTDHHAQALARDAVERRLAGVALTSGLGPAVTAAATLLA